MSVGRNRVSRIRVSVEPNGSLGVDRTGTIGNFGDVRTMPMAMPAKAKEILNDDRVIVRAWEQPLRLFGFRKGPNLEVKGHLTSTGQTLDASTAPVQTTLNKILGQMGTYYSHASGGSLVASGASTTGVTVTAAQGARFLPGTIGWMETASGSGLYQPFKVKTRSTDAITFAIALSFTPAVGAKVLNSQMVHAGDDPLTYLQWLIESEMRNDIHLAVGCSGPLKIEWTLGQLAQWSTTQRVAKWMYDSEIATAQGGAAIGATTAVSYDGGTPVPVTAGGIVLTTAAATTRTLPTIDKFEIDFGLTFVEIGSFNGTEGLGDYKMVRGPATCAVELPYETTVYELARDASTKYQLLAQAGNTPGKQIAIECPTIQITDVKKVDRNGLDYQRVEFLLLEDDNATDTTTELRRAPWRLAFG